jgi:sugar phosphate isomerase/epimerase
MNRRKFVQAATLTTTAVTATSASSLQAKEHKATRQKRYQNGATHWPICLDTATLSKELTLAEKVKLAADAGFDAIEPWDRELQKHEESGGNLKDLGKEIRDRGMYVPSVIGLWGALAPSKEIFNQEIDVHKKRLQMISDIGSEHVQVIPKFGLKEPLDKRVAAWSYSQVCEMAKDYNLKPAAIF